MTFYYNVRQECSHANPEDLILEVNQPHDEIPNIETRVDKPFSLLLKVECVDKTPVPSFAFNPKAIYEICQRQLIPLPFHINMLNEYECNVEYSRRLGQVARIFHKVETWFGYDVDISCNVVSPDKLHEVSQIRQASCHS